MKILMMIVYALVGILFFLVDHWLLSGSDGTKQFTYAWGAVACSCLGTACFVMLVGTALQKRNSPQAIPIENEEW